MGRSTWGCHRGILDCHAWSLYFFGVASSRKVTDRGNRQIGPDPADAPHSCLWWEVGFVVVEIKSIAGDFLPGDDGLNSVVVTSSDGTEEPRRATLLEVGTLTSMAGLHLVDSSIGLFRYAGKS